MCLSSAHEIPDPLSREYRPCFWAFLLATCAPRLPFRIGLLFVETANVTIRFSGGLAVVSADSITPYRIAFCAIRIQGRQVRYPLIRFGTENPCRKSTLPHSLIVPPAIFRQRRDLGLRLRGPPCNSRRRVSAYCSENENASDEDGMETPAEANVAMPTLRRVVFSDAGP